MFARILWMPLRFKFKRVAYGQVMPLTWLKALKKLFKPGNYPVCCSCLEWGAWCEAREVVTERKSLYAWKQRSSNWASGLDWRRHNEWKSCERLRKKYNLKERERQSRNARWGISDRQEWGISQGTFEIVDNIDDSSWWEVNYDWDGSEDRRPTPRA